MPTTWKCTKSVIMDTGQIAFTEGRVYQGHPSATPGGQQAMSFVDDQGQEHLMPNRALYRHFIIVDSA